MFFCRRFHSLKCTLVIAPLSTFFFIPNATNFTAKMLSLIKKKNHKKKKNSRMNTIVIVVNLRHFFLYLYSPKHIILSNDWSKNEKKWIDFYCFSSLLHRHAVFFLAPNIKFIHTLLFSFLNKEKVRRMDCIVFVKYLRISKDKMF